jgi:hypothetical protein
VALQSLFWPFDILDKIELSGNHISSMDPSVIFWLLFCCSSRNLHKEFEGSNLKLSILYCLIMEEKIRAEQLI